MTTQIPANKPECVIEMLVALGHTYDAAIKLCGVWDLQRGPTNMGHPKAWEAGDPLTWDRPLRGQIYCGGDATDRVVAAEAARTQEQRVFGDSRVWVWLYFDRAKVDAVMAAHNMVWATNNKKYLDAGIEVQKRRNKATDAKVAAMAATKLGFDGPQNCHIDYFADSTARVRIGSQMVEVSL